MKKIRSRYRIWDCGHLVPCWTRRPPTVAGAKPLTCTTLRERELGICWYLPWSTIDTKKAAS